MLVIGVDPGLGTKSALGVAAIDMEDFEIIYTAALWPSKRRAPAHVRIRELAINFRLFLEQVAEEVVDDRMIATEFFVMRGKSGQSLQRLIGALHAVTEDNDIIVEASNMRVKQCIGITGSGAATKQQVAKGVERWFKNKNFKSAEFVRALADQEQWDIIDALAIGITGFLEGASK